MITSTISELHGQGVDLNAKSMEEYDITLITAARRRFESWDKALTAAGLDYKKIVLRKPFKRGRREAGADAAAPARTYRKSAKAPAAAGEPTGV
jgi:hypothetical protein